MGLLHQLLEFLRYPPADTTNHEALDVLDHGFVRDPYPTYRWLRTNDPVHRMENGTWIVTRYRDIEAALRHPALGNTPSVYSLLNARNRGRFVCADVANNVLPFLDGPDHRSRRRMVSRALRAYLETIQIDFRATALRLLETRHDRAKIDAISDFGTPFSIEVVSRIMGFPPEDRACLERWSQYFFRLFAPMQSIALRMETDHALCEFRDYVRDFAMGPDARREDTLVSHLVRAEENGIRLSDAEIVDNCMLIFADGIENVGAGIANILLALERHPTEFRRLKAAPHLVTNAVEEGLRYDCPAQMIGRVALADLVLRDTEIKRGSAMFLALGSANRDADVFESPDTLDITRDPVANLTFGKGRHSCLGGTLARRMTEGAILALLDVHKDLQVETERLEWQQRFGHRWLKSLPIEINPGTS